MNTTDRIVDVNGTRYWAGEGGAASGVLPICPEQRTICLAWRSANVMSPNCWGTVGGAVQPGLTPAESARHELREEVGYDGEIELLPAYVFKDGDFTYHNFLGIVPTEFTFRPSAGHGWENSHICWRSYVQTMDDLERNPTDFHPGVRKLLIESEFSIRKALFEKRLPHVVSGAVPQTELNEWFVDNCSKSRAEALAKPEHWLNRLIAVERVSGPLYRGIKVLPDHNLLAAEPGHVWTFGPSSFSKNLNVALVCSDIRRPHGALQVLIHLDGKWFPGIDLTRHVDEMPEEEVIVGGSFVVVYAERREREGTFFIAIKPVPEATPATEGRKLYLDDVRQPSGWNVGLGAFV